VAFRCKEFLQEYDFANVCFGSTAVIHYLSSPTAAFGHKQSLNAQKFDRLFL